MSRLLDAIRRGRRQARFLPDGDPGPPIDVTGKRVLVVYLFPNLGDVLLLAPVLKALLDAGAKRVGVVVRKNPGRILKLVDLPLKRHVLPESLTLGAIAAGHEALWTEPETEAAATTFAKTIAATGYDIAVDLTARADIESRRWVAAAQATHRLGWLADDERSEDAGLTWGTADIRDRTERHWSRYLVLPIRCLGADEPAFDLEWSIRDTARTKARELYGPGAGPRVLVVPGSKSAAKRWPPECFATVGGRLARELGARIVVTGAPDEAPLIRQLVVDIGGRAAPYTGKDLATLVAVIQRADLVLTNDTAPMHVAFLSGQPTIAIFTRMSAICWGPPIRDPRFVVLNAPAEASPAAANAWTRAVYQHALTLLASPSKP